MRKSSLLTALFLMFSLMGFAQEWHAITSDSPTKMKKTLISSTENEVVVKVAIDGFYTQNVKTPNGKQVVVSVDRMASMLEAGAPDLPMEPISVIIGDRAEMQVSVVNSTYVDFENIEVAPSKGNFSRQINPDDVPYTYGEMYQQDAFWPAAQATLEAPYIMRDLRGQNIMVRPFAYNPVTKTLRVYTSMTIAMTKVSDNGENQKVARRGVTVKVAPEFEASYEHRFINYKENSRYSWIEDHGEMLVVCPDQYMNAMQPLVDWKNQSGRPTTMVSVTAAGGNNADAIKSYISNIYNDSIRNLVYVLLVGDYNDITPHPFQYNDGQSSINYSDIWFGMMEGTDYYEEVFVGRFSAQSEAQVTTQVNKVIYYERDMQEGMTWVDKGLGIGAVGAGSGHNGEDDYQHIDFIRDTLLHYTYTGVTDLHQGGQGAANATAAGISNTINDGVSIINYCNHGSVTSWGVCNYSNSNVNALINDNKLPFVISVACLNGKFVSDCFGEAWLRATNNTTGAPTGAIGGMFSWISQPWVPPMYGQDEMVDILTEWRHTNQFYHTMGGVALNGAMYVLDKGSSSDYQATQHSWILFGDPSVMLRTDNPTDMDVTVSPAVPMIGMDALTINAECDFGIATLSKNGEVVASANVVDGVAELTFEPFSEVTTYDLVVIGYNKVTYIGTVEVLPAEGAYVSVDSFTPGTVPVAEEQQMSMTFKNVGFDPTTGTTNVVLTSSDSNITFTDNEGSFGILAANETVTLANEFAFTVASGVADGTKIQIDVTATCGANVWSGKAKITVGAPIIEFASYQGAGSFEPGQTYTAVANFTNVGHYMATNATVTASSTSSYVTFAEPSVAVGTIDPEGTVAAIFSFTVDAACPTTEVLTLNFDLAADNGVTATGTGTLRNSCSIVFSLADSYGDGWNGNQLVVSFSDGTPQQNLTISSGSSATYTLEIGIGVHVTLTWITGSYTYECSFTVAYENGEVITSQAGGYGNPIPSNYNFQFDVNCASVMTTYDPVQNLAAAVEGNTVTLTWEAPAEGTPTGYVVNRNGVEVTVVTELTYVDEHLAWETTYNYTIVAQYEGGSSLPVAVTATTGVDAIGENEVIVGIYPNPADDVLNINANAESFEYQMLNSIGQVVMNGVANGSVELNVSDLDNGVYFLKVIANGNAKVEKVIIK